MKAQVTLYSKPGCHLCEEMKSEIARANCSDLYDLQEVNIESDAGLLARYRFDIPVLLIDDVEMFRHQLSAADFRDCLNRLCIQIEETKSAANPH